MRLAVDIEVGREPGDAGLVGQDGIAGQIGTGLQIMGMRALAHAPDRTPGEASAGFRDRRAK